MPTFPNTQDSNDNFNLLIWTCIKTLHLIKIWCVQVQKIHLHCKLNRSWIMSQHHRHIGKGKTVQNDRQQLSTANLSRFLLQSISADDCHYTHSNPLRLFSRCFLPCMTDRFSRYRWLLGLISSHHSSLCWLISSSYHPLSFCVPHPSPLVRLASSKDHRQSPRLSFCVLELIGSTALL